MTQRRRLSFSSWALIVAMVLFMAYGVGIFLFALRYPSDGLSGHLGGQGFVVNAVPEGSSVRKGDTVVAIEGRPISEGMNVPGQWHRFLFSGETSSWTYQVLRDNQVQETSVTWRPWHPLGVLSRMGTLLVVALFFFAAQFLIAVSRSADTAARLIALEFCIQGLNLLNDTLTSLGVNLVMSRAWLFGPINLLTFALGIGFFMHALLAFPERKWLLRRFPAGIYAIHVLNATVAVLAIAGVGGEDLLQQRSMIFGQILYPLAAVEMLVGMGHLIHTYVTTHRIGVRNQIRWVVWGTVIGPLPWLLLYNLPVILTGEPWVPLRFTNLTLILIPLSFFFSVTRRGLMVVDTLINRSLVYTGLTALLLGIYLGAVSVLEWTLSAVFDLANEHVSSLLAVIVVALVAAPARRRLQGGVDRAFYRRWVDFKSLLRDVGQRLSTMLHVDAMVPVLVEEIPRRLHIEQAALLLRDDDGACRSLDDAFDLNLGPTHPLIEQLEFSNEPLIFSQVRNLETELAALAAQRWEVALPLRTGGRLRGLYLLGARVSGDLYGREEVETLALLGQQIAVALENARLYREVERYSRDLETLVDERTYELEIANRRLAQERDRLDITLQNMADGLLLVSRGRRVSLINPAFASMVGTPEAQLVGRPIDEVLVCSELVDVIERAFRAPGQLLNADCEMSGHVLRATSTALSDGTGSITVVRDITHEVSVDRMKTEFISTVSHELRTPLTSVLGFAKLVRKALDRDVVTEIPEDAQRAHDVLGRVFDNLDIIIVEGERLTRLINDVLDVAKMESGKVEWHDRDFDLAAVIEQVVDSFRAWASQERLDLQVHLAQELPYLHADPDRIHQVLANLLSNAVKFTPEGGTVSVRMRSVPPEEMTRRWEYPIANAGGVLVSVHDTGVGIPETEMANLFQRFKQIRKDVLVDKPQGTGLGLSICRGIISHYRGLIWAESELDEGSTFSFLLPLPGRVEREAVAAPASPAQEPLEPVAAPSTAALSVLVVDDEPNVRKLLYEQLTDAGYQALVAANGTDALAMARRHMPSVILMDVMMPDISGFDVTQILKSDPTTASIPILILSIIEDEEYGLALGADAYLTKPVEAQDLLDTIAALLMPPQPARAACVGKAIVAGTDPSALGHVTHVLRERGFEVVEAYDPRGALVAAQQVEPDVLVLDEMLCRLNDAEVIKALRFQERNRPETIIVVAGNR
jgi:signal transduction histidine kinase/DNA-binding response OmpR family regulator